MIRKLQRKFVLAAMLSLFIVLGLLIGLINILNYRTLVTEADETLSTLAEIGENGSGGFTFGGKTAQDRNGTRTAPRVFRRAALSVALLFGDAVGVRRGH